MSSVIISRLAVIQDLITDSCQGGEGWSSDGIVGDIKLYVVSIAVEVETIMTDDLTEWENAEDKEEVTQH